MFIMCGGRGTLARVDEGMVDLAVRGEKKFTFAEGGGVSIDECAFGVDFGMPRENGNERRNASGTHAPHPPIFGRL